MATRHSTALKIALSVILLAVLVWHVGFGDVLKQLTSVDASLSGLALALLVAEALVRCANWRQLNLAAGCRITFGDVVYGYFVGGFVGCFLPSTLSTDAARSVIASKRSGARVETLLATTVSLNLVSLTVISVLALVACLAALIQWDDYPLVVEASAAISSLCLAGIATLLLWRRRSSMQHVPRQHEASGPIGMVRRVAGRFISALLVVHGGIREFVSVTATATLSYALRVVGWLVLIVAVGASVPLTALLILSPLTTLGAALPVSVLGFGGLQAISVYLLSHWGVTAEQAIAVSLLQSALYVLPNALGCIAFLIPKSPRDDRMTAERAPTDSRNT